MAPKHYLRHHFYTDFTSVFTDTPEWYAASVHPLAVHWTSINPENQVLFPVS